MTIDFFDTFLLVVIVCVIIGSLIRDKKPKEELALKPDNEAVFLEELVELHNYWKEKGEQEYADAYKVLINKFTQIPDEQ